MKFGSPDGLVFEEYVLSYEKTYVSPFVMKLKIKEYQTEFSL